MIRLNYFERLLKNFWATIRAENMISVFCSILMLIAFISFGIKTCADTITANKIAKEALSIAKEATKIADDTRTQSEQFSIINAEIAWNQVRDDYEELNIFLKKWEQRQNIKLGYYCPMSAKAWDKILDDLKFPEEIKQVYRKRYQKYETLQNMAVHYRPFLDRLDNIDVRLPERPKFYFPSPNNEGSINMDDYSKKGMK